MCLLVLLAAGCRTGEASTCTEARAIEAARQATSSYCAASPHGCAFAPRAPVANAGEDEPGLKWVVRASQIHSFDEQHRPRFMPEGSRTVHVSEGCESLGTHGHEAPAR